jgi:Mg2+-importing ATPase
MATSGDLAGLDLVAAARLEPEEVVATLGSADAGLSDSEAGRRLEMVGPNALRSHGANALRVLRNQLRNPLLPLLAIASVVSALTGQRASAAIILVMIALSVGLGFFNEYRSERAVEELHARIHHTATVLRGGSARTVDVTSLVPGDMVRLSPGEVVPADLRLLNAERFEVDEAVLTGESAPAEKDPAPVGEPESPIALPSCAFMGTVVKDGIATGVVVRTGSSTEFGKIALGLGETHWQSAFQQGLRDFSRLLVKITAILVAAIFVVNLAIGRPLIDAVLFSLAVAVGLTPEMLPAIVTISLSAGAKRMAQHSVLVRRLVAIEDLGNVRVLFTDKTGTLTEGRTVFREAVDAEGRPSSEVLTLGAVCSDVVLEGGEPTGGSPLDRALWESEELLANRPQGWTRIDEAPFDHERRMMTALVDGPRGRLSITKGAPESVLAACVALPEGVEELVNKEFDSGTRLVAVATRDGSHLSHVSVDDEHDLALSGFLAFSDPPKADVGSSLSRLGSLGIELKIVTGDNDRVARKVWSDLGMPVGRVVGGADIDAMDDRTLKEQIPGISIFARVTPEQKSRIIRTARTLGLDVGFLGDGVNDAVALHDADVGISVDTATDVAKDAADILLLKKDLGILADGVVEGRRIFANTIKYVLMATSSNFGNMFSAAGASAFLKFLPMEPGQILLNNLLYDTSQTTIPTDRVDPESLSRPSRWDTRFIRRFMTFFGPISSVFDFATFAVLLWVLHAHAHEFQTGWFVESLATQTLVIFVIRTRRIPFFKSRPSAPQFAMTLFCAGAGVLIPYIGPVARLMGFRPLPRVFLLIMVGFAALYLTLAEFAKAYFFRRASETPEVPMVAPAKRPRGRRIHRRAARFSHKQRVPNRPSTTRRPSEREGQRTGAGRAPIG